jgi:hypothetical protein
MFSAAKRRKNAAHGATGFGKTPKSATGALKGRGFKPRRTLFPRAYGKAGRPCPFKTLRREFFRSLGKNVFLPQRRRKTEKARGQTRAS